MNFSNFEVILIVASILLYIALAHQTHRKNWYKNHYEAAEYALQHARRELVKSIIEK